MFDSKKVLAINSNIAEYLNAFDNRNFKKNENIDLVDYSEADLFHHVWLFVYNCFKSSQVKAKLGERGSRSSALGRNSERVLESTKRRERKASGAKVDVLFKAGVRKVGCAEVGKDDVLVVDDKYIDDDLIKLPKALRHMLRELVNINPQKINELYTVGFLMMGLKIELVAMDVPASTAVTRISRSKRYSFRTKASNIGKDLLSLLKASLAGKQLRRIY